MSKDPLMELAEAVAGPNAKALPLAEIVAAHRAKYPELFDIVEGGYVHYTRPAGDPLLDEARQRPGYVVVPHPAIFLGQHDLAEKIGAAFDAGAEWWPSRNSSRPSARRDDVIRKLTDVTPVKPHVPVLQITCGQCKHWSDDNGVQTSGCDHPDAPDDEPGCSYSHAFDSPKWCPLKAEALKEIEQDLRKVAKEAPELILARIVEGAKVR